MSSIVETSALASFSSAPEAPVATISTSPAPSSMASKAAPHISSGVLAGVGIACAAVGAVLASFVLCSVMIRRRSSGGARSASTDGRSAKRKMDIGYARLPRLRLFSKSGGASLAPPLQDGEIAAGLLHFGTSMANHAHGFFDSGGAGGSIDLNQGYLAQLLGSSPLVSAEELTFLLVESSTRTASVRFLLAWCILQHIRPGGDPCRSLLPPEIAESMESMHVGGLLDEGHAKMLARWRQMTAFLMSNTYNTTDICADDPRQRNISDFTDALNAVLAQLASRDQDMSRKQDLNALIVQGAHYGWQLFSQPAAWTFRWEASGDRDEKGELVVLPALLQTGDEKGRPHQVARAFTEAQTVKLAS